MANDKVETVIVRITEDKAAAARVQQVINQTRANLRQMGDEAKRLPLAAVDRDFKKTFDPSRVEKFNRELADLRQSIAGVGDTAETSSAKVGGMLSAYRQVQSAQKPTGLEMPEFGKGAVNLSRLGSDIKALPAVPIPGTGLSTDVAGKALNILGRTGASLSDLALAGGIAAPAIAAVGVALTAYNAILAKSKSDLEAATNAQRKYYEFVKDGDTKSAEARLEELRSLLETEGAITAENANALKQSFDSTAQAYGDFGARILTAISPADDQLNAVTDESLKRFKEYEIEYTRLKQALEGGTFATKDAAKAEEELRKAREANARGNIDKMITAQQEAAQLAATGTSESYKARLDSLAIERKAILDNLDDAKKLAALSGDNSQVNQLKDRLSAIDTIMNTIMFGWNSGGSNPMYVDEMIKAREAEEKAAEDAKQKTEDLAKSIDKLKDAQRKFSEIEDTYNSKLADISANLAKAASDKLTAIDKAIADANEARSDLIAKANDDLSEEEREAAKDREKLARDHAKAIQKIIRDGNRDQQIAIEDRDAVALDRAQQAQKAALDDENDAYDERTQEIDDRLKEQNRLVAKRLAEQLREVDKRLQEQTQVAIARYNEQVQVANAQRQAALDNYNKQLSDLRYALSQDANIRAAGYGNMLKSSQMFATGLTAIGASMINQLAELRNAAAGTPTNGRGREVPTPYARGIANGLAPAFKDILVGENSPEILRLPRAGAVFTPEQYMKAGRGVGNISITVNANGLNEAQAKRVMKQALVEVIGR